MTRLDRRSFLKLAGAAGLAAATGCRPEGMERSSESATTSTTHATTTDTADRPSLWSDPDTWGGRIPGAGDVPVITDHVLLDVDASVAGVSVEESGALVFDPESSRTLESTGNLLVRGRLSLQPRDADTVHSLRFAGIDESAFIGAGMSVLDSDVGLWVLPAGILELWGSFRLPWTRSAAGLSPGDSTIRLLDQPTGWRPGDELVILPTSAPGTDGHRSFEERELLSIEGNTIRLDRLLETEHPAVEVGRGMTLTAEVLNLTRNVVISGTPEGRAHTVILGHTDSSAGMPGPQRSGYFRLEHMGPHNSRAQPVHFAESVEASQPIDDRTGEPLDVPVLARWPFHFHHLGDASRGSLIEGVVAYKPSSHAFVAHQSHGVTFESCIAYDAVTSPFWWDGDGKAPDPDRANVRPPDHTDDGHYRNCVAAKVRMFEGADHLTFEPIWAEGWGPDKVRYAHELLWPGYTGARLGGFTLIKEGGRVTGGIASGVEGSDSAGVVWPAAVAGTRWEVEDLVVHNNGEHGAFVWHNSQTRHAIRRMISYHNSRAGIFHGAYANPYLFADCVTFGNGVGVEWHANADAKAESAQEWHRLLCDGDWEAHPHAAGGERRTVYRECSFLGTIRFLDREGRRPAAIEFVDCTHRGKPLQPGDLDLSGAHPDNDLVFVETKESPRLDALPPPPLPSANGT